MYASWIKSPLRLALTTLTLVSSVNGAKHSLKDDIRPWSTHIQQLVDDEAPVEHPLQVIRPNQLTYKRKSPALQQSASGEGSEMSADEVTLSVSTTVFSNRDKVIVTLDNRGKRGPTQWVGAYSPADANISEVVPVKYAFPDKADSQYTDTGMANITFRLVNMRADYKFYFFDCGVSFPACSAEAESPVVHVDDKNAPLKPRVLPSDGDDPTQLRVMWSSNEGPQTQSGYQNLNSASKGAVVEWGTSADDLKNVVKADSYTYTAKDMCAPPAIAEGYRDIGWIHEAVLHNLPPGKTIYYRFGNNDGGGEGGSRMGQVEALRVPPRIGTSGTQLFLYGDMGRGSDDDAVTWRAYGEPSLNTSTLMEKQISTEQWGHGVFHIGDISYATGYAAVWDEWLDMVAPVAKAIPYTVNGGNHENDCPADLFHKNQTPTFYPGSPHWSGGDSGGECGVPMTRLLKTPRSSYNEQWWSWNIGNVHVVAMNTEYDFRRGSKQYEWLDNDLQNVDRSKTPWIIFGGHRPMYISSTYDKGPMNQSDQEVASLLRDHVEPLLKKYKVDLAIWGHNHSVQRFCASYKNICRQRSQMYGTSGNKYVYENPEYPIHNVIGTGGASFTVNSQNPSPNVIDRPVFYKWGYAQVEAVNATHLHWKFVDNGTPYRGRSNPAGTILDEFLIVKQSPSKDEPHHGKDDKQKEILIGSVSGGVVLIAFVVVVVVLVIKRRRRGNRSGEPISAYQRHKDLDASTPRFYDPEFKRGSTTSRDDPK